MFRRYLTRGLAAGAVAGLAYGLFVAVVGNPLVGYTESFGHHHGAGHAVPAATTAVASVVGGVLWGLLLGGAVLGVGFYFLEPAVPGEGSTKSYALAGAGFLVVSGAPWLLLPPQPGGVEQALSTSTRELWYGVMAVSGALACVLASLVYGRLADRLATPAAVAVSVLPFLLLAVPVALGPSNPVTGTVPASVTATFRATVVAGQVGLWAVAATAHARLRGQSSDGTTVPTVPRPAER